MAKIILSGGGDKATYYRRGLEGAGHEVIVASCEHIIQKCFENMAYIIVMLTESMNCNALEVATDILRDYPGMRVVLDSDDDIESFGFRHGGSGIKDVLDEINRIIEKEPAYENYGQQAEA